MTTAKHVITHSTIVPQKPLMNMRQILLMNLGFFGIQYSFGMQRKEEQAAFIADKLPPRSWPKAF